MQHMTDRINRLEEGLSSILMIALVLVLFYQIVARYFFRTGLDWSEEISRFLFLWLVFWSTSYAALFGAHIRVTAPLNVLPNAVRKWILALADLAWIGFNVVVIYHGTLFVQSMFTFKRISPVLGWNEAYIYLVVPVTFLTSTIRIIQYRRHEGIGSSPGVDAGVGADIS